MARRLTEEEVPGVCFIVCGPSGAGKATLLRRLLDEVPGLALVHSLTTRSPRPDDLLLGKYKYVDEAIFEAVVARDEFLEWAEVHGRYYGTPISEVLLAARGGKDIVLEVDYQGASQARPLLPDLVSIFIEAPDMTVLAERLHRRDAEAPPEEIEIRLRTAEEEIRHRSEFDYVIVNDVLEAAFEALRAIVVTERARPERVLRRGKVTSGA